MNTNYQKVATSGVTLVVTGLSFDKKLTKEEFDSVMDELSAQAQAAKADFATIAEEDVEAKVLGAIEAGLEGIKAGLNEAGITKYDGVIEEGESFDQALAGNGGHPFAALIKTVLEKIFKKKTSAAPVTASTSADESAAK